MKNSPVFCLTEKELYPALISATRHNNPKIIQVRYEKKLQTDEGYGADKSVPTIIYKSGKGKTKAITIFIKWLHNREHSEAMHYDHVQRLGGPVPHLYASYPKNGRELLFLEYLECHPEPDINAEFASLTARFNTITPDARYKKQLQTRDFKNDLISAKETLVQIWNNAVDNMLGKKLHSFCISNKKTLNALIHLADVCADKVINMQKGLIHTDLYPENCGRRATTGELLIIDLEHLAHGPIFFDIARWVGFPAQDKNHIKSLSQAYLSEYSTLKKDHISFNDFISKAKILWATGVLVMLWFSLKRAIDGQTCGPGDLEKGRNIYRTKLLRKLKQLRQFEEDIF